jgi:hypothetical protein
MSKAMMMVIRAAITRGVITLPLKRNLVPRLIKEGAQKMMKHTLIVEKGGHQDSWEGGKLLGFSSNFSFHEWAT